MALDRFRRPTPHAPAAMRRAASAMFLAGGGTALIGVWTTAATPTARLGQGLVAVGFLACGATLTAVRSVARGAIESAAFGAVLAIGVLVAVADPLGMAPTFFLWPVVLLAYFSSSRLVLAAVATMVVALGVALLANTDAALRLDTFVGTVSSVALMAWLVAAMTRRQQRTSAELARAAQTDPLTGALNRRALAPRLAELIAEAAERRTDLTVVTFDLDHFKQVNDSHGHLVGDQVLTAAVGALATSARTADLVARVGGEEFLVVLPGANAAQAVQFAARAAAAIRAGTSPPVSVSAGICSLSDDVVDEDTLLRCADRALYVAKDEGRGRSVVWGTPPVVGPPFEAEPEAAATDGGVGGQPASPARSAAQVARRCACSTGSGTGSEASNRWV